MPDAFRPRRPDIPFAEPRCGAATLAGREAQARGPAPVLPRPRIDVNLTSAGRFGIG